MNNEAIDLDLIDEALAVLVRSGLVYVFINEDGERVFRLIENPEN